MTSTTGDQHVVDLLEQQHQRVRDLFAQVEQAQGETKQERFDELRELLAVHETAEEMVVHPEAKKANGGEAIVDSRLEEEHDAKEMLSQLDSMKVTDAGFAEKFGQLKQAVTAHAESEERDEFPLLRAETDADKLHKMAEAVRRAESMAPTHPHAGAESRTANMAAGPIASLVDRTRDAVSSVMKGS